jgi:hypothetical protein
MKPLDELLPALLPYTPGCPEPLAVSGLRQAAMAFCEQTRLWRDTSTQSVSPHQEVLVPFGAQLRAVISARFDGRKVEAVALSELDRRYPHQDWRELEGSEPRYLTQVTGNRLQLVPASSGELLMTLELLPGFDADELPAFIIDRYSSVLVDGALGYLLQVPGQPFSNPELAIMYERRFQQALDRHAANAVRGQMRSPLRTKSQLF